MKTLRSKQMNAQPSTWMNERSTAITPEMTFSEAAKLWMDSRTPTDAAGGRVSGYIRKHTEIHDWAAIRSLNLYFEAAQLRGIRLDHMATYQRLRATGAAPFIRKRRPHEEPAPCPVKPQQVNAELAVLIRILKLAKLWTEEEARLYSPLIEETSNLPRSLSLKEQRHWLAVARSASRWSLVHWYSLVAFDTCMGTNEMRSLRLGDVNLDQQLVTVPIAGAKNIYRHRSIPIASPDALWALEKLVGRAHSLGAKDATHYLFPRRRVRDEYDPASPMSSSGLKKQWQEVRRASGLAEFRPYDTRHTAITRLAEGGTPMAVIMKRAGHVSPAMTDHYTHITDKFQLQSVRSAIGLSAGITPHADVELEASMPRYSPVRHSSAPVHAPPVAAGAQQRSPDEGIAAVLLTMQQYGVTPDQMKRALGGAERVSAKPSKVFHLHVGGRGSSVRRTAQRRLSMHTVTSAGAR